MPIEALKQATTFEIQDWERDAEFGVYPQGARAKDAVIAPADCADVLVPFKRYLFKRSSRFYPDQFWAEVIAYRVGCLMGVAVPPAFVATDTRRGLSGALIEWFYDSSDLWVYAGDFLQRARPDFDRKKGSSHNLQENIKFLRAIEASDKFTLENDWKEWWIDALLFDALIGNTDRHQDNWGLVWSPSDGQMHCRLSPCFDNGTSLGHERFPERVNGWTADRLAKYVADGEHHVRWSLADDEAIKGHEALVMKALTTWSSPAFDIAAPAEVVSNRLRRFSGIGWFDRRLRARMHCCSRCGEQTACNSKSADCSLAAPLT
jgi:hypothetical protein